MDYDLAIVGSGGGAFAAAIAARRMGLRVAMIERGTVSGTCVNIGCIPSKVLLASAEAHHRAGLRRFPGITTEAGPVDFPALIAGKREIVETMRREKYIDLAVEYGFELLLGNATSSTGRRSTSTGDASRQRTTWWRPAPNLAPRTSPA